MRIPAMPFCELFPRCPDFRFAPRLIGEWLIGRSLHTTHRILFTNLWLWQSLDAHRFNSQMEKFRTAAKEVHAIYGNSSKAPAIETL